MEISQLGWCSMHSMHTEAIRAEGGLGHAGIHRCEQPHLHLNVSKTPDTLNIKGLWTFLSFEEAGRKVGR